jgi:hypothetical protein
MERDRDEARRVTALDVEAAILIVLMLMAAIAGIRALL